MVAVVLAVISVSLWRGSQRGAEASQQAQDRADDPVKANAAVYKDQIRDLEKEYVLGNLNSEELQIARDELARRLLEDVHEVEHITKPTPQAWRAPWVWVMSFVFLVPVASMLIYATLGQPLALEPAALQADSEHGNGISPEKMTEMATALTRRLQDDPNQIDGWVMLARVQEMKSNRIRKEYLVTNL